MPEDKIRLGGMALANGVLVHGPTAWACAIRTPEGELKVESAPKSFRASEVEQPFLRGPARLAESLAFLPRLRKLLPEARFPFERPAVLAAMLGSAVVIKTVHDSDRVGVAAQELLNGVLSVAPAALALRGSELFVGGFFDRAGEILWSEAPFDAAAVAVVQAREDGDLRQHLRHELGRSRRVAARPAGLGERVQQQV